MTQRFTVIVRPDTTPDEIVWAMQATRAWWAQFEPDVPDFVLAADVPSVDDLRERSYDRYVGDER